MKAVRTYVVSVPIVAHGVRIFRVRANSEEEALDIAANDGLEPNKEELEEAEEIWPMAGVDKVTKSWKAAY